MKSTLCITEDHQLFADGIFSMLTDIDEIQVTGCYNTVSSTKTMLSTNPCDILLLDFNLPDANGIEIIDFIKKNNINTKVIIVSMYFEASFINIARKRGANAFVSKNVAKEKLIHTIKMVLENGSYYENSSLNNENEIFKIFTGREIEVIEFFKAGFKVNEISEKLNISLETVRTHRKNILFKLKQNPYLNLFNNIDFNI